MGEPDSQIDDSPWGHASGWAQLSGTQHNVSCVVLGLADSGDLATLFDSLSDALTEAGYPWEVLMVDVGASGRLSALLGAWCGRPGFRRIALPAGTPTAATLTTALKSARGDAVLLTTAHSGVLAPSIPEMITRWSEGTEIVQSRWVDPFGQPAELPTGALTEGSDDVPAPAGDALKRMLDEEAFLLDRHTVNSLLGER